MQIGEICTRETVYCNRTTTALEAASLMRNHHVGDLVVVEEPDGERVPIGIITDRDLVVEVLATELDPVGITAGDIMSQELVVAVEEEDLSETVQRMRLKGIRRMPVVNRRGGLVGIATLDDVVEFMAETLVDIARVSKRQEAKEEKTRP